MNFALIGLGRVGRVHAANIASHPQANLHTIADPRAPQLEELARWYGASLTTEPETVFADPGVDAVVISSPTTTHIDYLQAAAQSGKAALCEKPMGIDIDRVERCLRLLEDLPIPVMIGFHRRHDPSYAALRDSVRAGAIGRLEQVMVHVRDPAPPTLEYVRVSGGVFRDSVIHYFDLLRWLTGEDPVSVSAFGSCLIDPGIGLEGDYDTTLVNLRLPSGALCHIASSRRSVEGADARIEVFGSEGVLRVANAPINLLEPPVAGIRYIGFPTRFEEAFRNELNSFIEAVSTSSSPVPGPEDGRRSLIIADAATSSALNSNAVDIRY
ncbi:MAG: inositol 2-dehydrogenase [Caldilineaceae bacterium SB0666_bin_21]|nr:inositol 2-dehydrogenase [Caldilineaceae bacterium SB0666_bin_21]